eukprot:scaffold3359_cov123-Cylindrotheca_fusiformis.AAC.9
MMTKENPQFRRDQNLLMDHLSFPSETSSTPVNSDGSGSSKVDEYHEGGKECGGETKQQKASKADGDDDDELLVDKAFFGSYLETSDSETENEEYFHPLYLHEEGEEFLLTPVLFEDGMSFDECELYYVTQEEEHDDELVSKPLKPLARRNLPSSFRSTLPLRRLEDEEELPSCLRSSTKLKLDLRRRYNRNTAGTPRQPRPRASSIKFTKKQRRRSFGGVPTLPTLPEFFRPHSCPDFSTLTCQQFQPKVNFDTDVQVVTVYSVHDYPRKVRANLWLTKKEIARFKRQAKKEKLKRRQKKYLNYSSDEGSSSSSDWSK